MICKRCGRPIKSMSLKCGSCGEKHTLSECSGNEYKSIVQKPVNVGVAGEDKPSTKLNIPLISGIAAVAVACVVILCITFIGGHGDDESTSDKNSLINPVQQISQAHTKFTALGELGNDITVKNDDDAKKVLGIVADVYGYKDVDKELKYADCKETELAKHYRFCQADGSDGSNMIVSVYNESTVLISGNCGAIDKKTDAKKVIYDTSQEEAEAVLKEAKSEENELEKIENDIDQDADKNSPEKNEKTERERNIREKSKNEDKVKVVEQENKNGVKEGKVVIYPYIEDAYFKSTVVSNGLYQIYSNKNVNEQVVEKIWNDAIYLLTADSTYDEFMTAVQFVARQMGYKEVFDFIGSSSRTIELIGKDASIKVGASTPTEISAMDCNCIIRECDTNLNILDRQCDKFEVGKYYHVEVSGKFEGAPKVVTSYVYCKDAKADLVFYTDFDKKSNGDGE